MIGFKRKPKLTNPSDLSIDNIVRPLSEAECRLVAGGSSHVGSTEQLFGAYHFVSKSAGVINDSKTIVGGVKSFSGLE
jgi:hypothetical protein